MQLSERPFVYNRLPIVRAAAKTSQIRLVKKSGVSRWRLQLIEAGIISGTESEREALAQALGVSQATIWPDLSSETVAA